MVALLERVGVVTAGTFLENACQPVGYPGRHSRRPSPGWCRSSIGEMRNWILLLGCTAARSCWLLPRSPGFHGLETFAVAPVDMLVVEVAKIETGVWERRDGHWCKSRAWKFVDVNDLISFDVYVQSLSLWLLWRLIDQ